MERHRSVVAYGTETKSAAALGGITLQITPTFAARKAADTSRSASDAMDGTVSDIIANHLAKDVIAMLITDELDVDGVDLSKISRLTLYGVYTMAIWLYAQGRPITMAEMAERASINKATAKKYLDLLVKLGLLYQPPDWHRNRKILAPAHADIGEALADLLGLESPLEPWKKPAPVRRADR